MWRSCGRVAWEPAGHDAWQVARTPLVPPGPGSTLGLISRTPPLGRCPAARLAVAWPCRPAQEGSQIMDTVTKDHQGSSLRLSDADRDRAAAELSEHFQAGRLAADELDDRVGRALQARTAADLAPLFADLPGKRPAATGPGTHPGSPAPFRSAPVPAVPIAIIVVIALG